MSILPIHRRILDEADIITNEADDLMKAIAHNDLDCAMKFYTSMDDETEPERDERCRRLRNKIYAFWSLPEPEQRRLLGGWKPWYKHPSAEEVACANFTSRVARLLEVRFHPEGRIYSDQYFLNTDDYALAVQIPEGMPKKAAIDALSKIIDALEKDFDSMIDSIPNPTIYSGLKVGE